MLKKIKLYLKNSKIWRSFKVRLFLIMFLIGMLPAVLMRVGILENYESRAVDVRVSDVQTQLRIIANHLITYNYLQDTSSEVIGAELEQLSNLYNGRVLIINGNLKVVKDTYGISEGKTIISEEVIRCMKGSSTVNYDSVNRFIEITVPIVETVTLPQPAEDGSTSKEVVRGVMLNSVSTDSIINTMDILNRKAMIMESIMLIGIFAFVLLLVQVLVRPFERVTNAINEMKEGYRDEPISVPDYLETEHIVEAFNSLLERMRTLDDSRLAQPDAPAELYREFLADIATEIEREDKIINDLLALVKQDKSVAEMNISVVNLNALTEIILKRLRPIARKNNIEITMISKRQVTAEVDEVKMSLILTNLVENAIKYNREQGKVEVSLDADHQFFTVQVKDTGIGIPEEYLGQIYERFYRVDKSHSKEIGGTGLGLAITRSAVLLHRGSIKAESVEGEGTTFTVKIPLSRTLIPV